MNPGQREHRRRELLDRRISAPLEESRGRGWWAETADLVGAKPGGSPYVHCELTATSGEGHHERGAEILSVPYFQSDSPLLQPAVGKRPQATYMPVDWIQTAPHRSHTAIEGG